MGLSSNGSLEERHQSGRAAVLADSVILRLCCFVVAGVGLQFLLHGGRIDCWVSNWSGEETGVARQERRLQSANVVSYYTLAMLDTCQKSQRRRE
jgi:hypothetical protein